jgi:hypothetical protein
MAASGILRRLCACFGPVSRTLENPARRLYDRRLSLWRLYTRDAGQKDFECTQKMGMPPGAYVQTLASSEENIFRHYQPHTFRDRDFCTSNKFGARVRVPV